jgi:pimeloyl-ACP methyl ester carboxylesterase
VEIIIDGIRQAYHVAGQGPVCVVLPGGPGCHWSYLRSPELEEHFTLVYVEPVGTGDSGRLADPADYVMTTYVRYAAALITGLGLEPALVLGHSYGGCVAQQLTLEHPDLVSGLVLYDSPPVVGAELFDAASRSVDEFAERFPDRPEAVAAVAAFRAGMGDDDASATTYLRAITPIYLADYWGRRAEFDARIEKDWILYHEPAAALDDMAFDTRDHLAEITAPTLVVAGAHDFIAGPRWAQVLHDGITGSELAVVESSGHFPHLEDPAAFVRAVVGAFGNAQAETEVETEVGTEVEAD